MVAPVNKVKKYNLAGLSANVELGKQGSYIAANANVIGFYTSSDVLQQIEIANITRFYMIVIGYIKRLL